MSNNVNAYRKEGNYERPYGTLNGIAMLLLVLGLVGAEVFFIGVLRNPVFIIGNALLIVFILVGFFSLQPNEAGVLTLFGDYLGTERKPGLRWTWPWNMRKRVSVRARNHAVDTLKVNDKRGNPVEIGAVVVWRVSDTAQATFDVDDFEQFVHVQSESAVRHVAARYNYDEYEDHEAHEMTLRGGADAVAEALREELQVRVQLAGVAVEEAKITHLAYAPEIAGAMLRRQQAEAVLAARRYIVQGAVEMVEHALTSLSERDVVKLDDERRATMVSNLLVVLCGDRDAQPVVNAGTLYQ
jgi:regulator of protease activity HflC (stomatin/prohibitin superfamily)